MRFWVVEPEVAGGLGAATVMDTSTHPPIIHELNYEFEGWLGDPILESFPVYIVTLDLARAIEAAALTGVERFAEVQVSMSTEFTEMHPDRVVPAFRWMKVSGVPGRDDVALRPPARLVVSDRALEVLRREGMTHADVEPF